jgi:hypothetical protein
MAMAENEVDVPFIISGEEASPGHVGGFRIADEQ